MSDNGSNVVTVEPEPRHKWAAWVGFFLHLVVAVFPFGAAGLVAPLYGIGILYAGWLGLLAVALARWNKHPLQLLLLPVVDIAWMILLLTLGDVLLGWTA